MALCSAHLQGHFLTVSQTRSKGELSCDCKVVINNWDLANLSILDKLWALDSGEFAFSGVI